MLVRENEGMLSEMDKIWTERMRTLRSVLFPFWGPVIGRIGIVPTGRTQATDWQGSLGGDGFTHSTDEVVLFVEEFTIALGEPWALEVRVASWHKGMTDVHVFCIP